ncbi:MAG: hypothetical protein V4594_18930 [Bacteroidota bacterium]
MKRKLVISSLCAVFVLTATAYGQQAGLVTDQNPRYEISRAKYMNVADSLTSSQGTTVQNTYKAYDWYEAREERRKLRREARAANAGNDWFYPSVNYYPGYYNNWGYGGGYNSWGRHNWRRSSLWLGW